MDIVLITQPRIVQNEAFLICKLFDAGLEKLHIRKPAHSALEISSLLDSIPKDLWSNIVMHRQPELVNDYGLAGYHHQEGEEIRVFMGTTSQSVHHLEDLSSLNTKLNYVFYGPVFQSISKKGYEPKVALSFVKETLSNLSKLTVRPKVYALGGVRRKKIIPLAQAGFDGFALLGSIWGHSEPVVAFRKFNDCYLESVKNPVLA
jgi:thiamine-phosphate pyrophosphorylase